MQDVDNDMDDLFRKAAEGYPLKTDGADWQKIAAGLDAAAMPAAEEKEKRRRGVLWLLLLLPLALLWAVHYEGDNLSAKQATVIKGSAENKAGYSSAQKSNTASTGKLSSKEEIKDNTSAVNSSDETKGDVKTFAINNDRTPSIYNNKENLHRENKASLSATGFIPLKNKNNSGYQQALTGNYTDAGDYNKNNFSALQPNVSFNRIDKEKAEEPIAVTVINDSIQNKADSTTLAAAKTDSAATSNTSSNGNSKQVKIKPRIQHGFYAGLSASFDVSTVKLQRIHKTGNGLQALVGYRFSNRLSIESGLGWSLKNYYSRGKYFDKKNAKIPDAVNIYFTNGDCRMLEVPLSVKYDFVSRRKSNLFVTAGLSSYFMKKENYSYTGDYMGWVYDTTRHYKNSGSNLFSIASLSIGYQLHLNKNLSLRAEPYIKMPLHGIGTAKLPITSTGITVGFTRSF